MITQAPPPDAAGEIVVIQADRDAAARLSGVGAVSFDILAGHSDDNYLVQAFARHRDVVLRTSAAKRLGSPTTPTDPLRTLSVGEAVERLSRQLLTGNGVIEGTSRIRVEIADLQAALSQSNAAQARGFAEAREAAAKAVRERIYPKNPRSDWSTYAHDRAEMCDVAEEAIRALSQGSGSRDGGGVTQANQEDRLTPAFLSASPFKKWELLTLNGLLGTDEPWIEHMRSALREQEQALENALSRQPAPPASGDVGELVERLRVRAGCEFDDDYPQALSLLNEAATLLESLSRNGEVERLREALEGLLEANENDWEGLMSAREKARAALQPEQRG